MKVAIMGAGRSGTTVLYHLLQELLHDYCGEKLEFVYEPFLWDRDTFNVRFKAVGDRTHYMSSLSVDGIYHDQHLPLFITDQAPRDNDYVKGLFVPRQEGNTLLVKFIRAHGRYRLLKQSSPQCKFLFIIRNPVDVINSVLNMFSFFGEDFHKSDFPRFIDQVNEIYQVDLNKDVITDQVERAALYWYYMNRFALQSFTESEISPMLISFEHFIGNKAEYIQKICTYLEIPYKEKYVHLLQRNVGPSYSMSNLTGKDLIALEQYLAYYKDFLIEYRIENDFNPEKIIGKYRNRTRKRRSDDICFGKTPLVIKKYYNSDFRPRRILHAGLLYKLSKLFR